MGEAKTKIPVLDLTPEIESLWDELQLAIESVLRSRQFILGPNVAAFEREVAAYLDVRHAVGVNSGTDALVIALRALDVGPGDEVITSPFTFVATAEAIQLLGATPVFADIEPDTFTLDPAQVEAKLSPRTRGLLPVHLFGQAADMDPLLAIARQRGLFVVEDVAQAFGAEYQGRKLGSLGLAGAFSFFPSKNLGAYGDAGMLATDDPQLAEKARMLRAHGSRRKYWNEILGYNSRLDELQAAILRVKLPRVEGWNACRRGAAHVYNELLGGIPGLICPPVGDHRTPVFHQYTVRIPGGRRDDVRRRLEEEGISSMVYYPVPLHRFPVYGGENLSLPQSERAAAEVLSLPLWPQITPDVQQRVADALRQALA